jgi:HEAT repeat protein
VNDAKRLLSIALDEEQPLEQRLGALRALADLGDPAVVEPLSLLYADVAGDLKRALHAALTRLFAVDTLLAGLQSHSAELRAQAARVLGLLRDPSCLTELIDALNDADHHVREQAASALAKVRDPRAMPHLILRLELDAHPDVRGAAAQALGELDAPEACEALEHATAKEEDVFTVILIERSILRYGERQDALRFASMSRGKSGARDDVTVLGRRVSSRERGVSSLALPRETV